MLAVQFKNKRAELTEVPRPIPGRDEVLVRVRACGICGSDMTILDLGLPIAGIPGHEIGGELEDGTPVAIEPIVPCNACPACQDGDYQVCPEGIEAIYGIARDGGMAEFISVPVRCLVPLPRGLDPRSACLVEPLAVALHGVRRAALAQSARVLVIGGGSIGLMTSLALRANGIRTSLVARHETQATAASQFGAEVVDSGDGGDYDVVFDCAGTESAGVDACNALRPRGLYMMLAPAWGNVILPGMTLAAKELNLRVSMLYGAQGDERDVEVAAHLLSQHEDVPESLISHRFALSEAPAAFQMARNRQAGAIKVVLEP